MPYLYYILLSLLLLSACQGEKKSKGDQNQITVDSAQSRKTTGPKYVKSVQFVYPMKFDTCRFNEELKIVYANNKHYKIDSAHLFFNQKQIAPLDSATREFVFKIPKEKCGTNTLKVIAFHPNNKCGVATQSFIVKPDKAPQPLQYQLVKTYSHAMDASTQGLVYIDGIIYEGTGIKGQSTLRKIDLENNKTLAMLGLDSQYFGEGITVYKDKSFSFITKQPPGSVLLKKAAGIASGSGEPNKKKVATLSKVKLMEVVNTKLPDLNTKDPERAARILAGQARQMGIEVEGM